MRKRGRHQGTKRPQNAGESGGVQAFLNGDAGIPMSSVGAAAHRAPRGGALTTAVLPYVTAGVALVGANALVLNTLGPPAAVHADIRVVHEDVALAGSILNIPINLLIDIINIPSYEISALDLEARGFLYGGPWIVTGASNVWGEDPADYARFFAGAALTIPIPWLSGFNPDDTTDGQYMIDGNGFAQQFAKFLAAEWPVDPNCTAARCVPNTPVSPITGITGLDTTIWNIMMLVGAVDFPVLSNLFKVGPWELLTGYNFGTQPSYDGQVFDGLGIKGTIPGAEGSGYDWVMPWSNTTFRFDPISPFANWLEHLMDDPAKNPIKLPSLEALGRAIQTFIAGLVMSFNPFTPGSSLCPGFCAYMSQDQASPAIIKVISNLWPGNTSLESWIASYDSGTANVPTDADISRNIELWRGAYFDIWDFGNPLLSDDNINYGGNPSNLAKFFHAFWTAIGLKPPPLEVDTNYVTDAGLQGGVYALKGMEIPLLLILESDLENRTQANAYVNAFATPEDQSLGNVVNTLWWEPSADVGLWSLSKTIGEDKTPTIYGFDKGALIASQWKRNFNDNYSESGGVTPTFVLTGNPARPNGGFSTRIDFNDQYGAPYTVSTPTFTKGAADGQVTTTDIAYQYDPVADLPTNFLNPIALLNSLAGFVNHYKYSATGDPAASAVSQGQYGDTNYYLIPSTTVPLLYGLQAIPFIGNTLADMLDPLTRALIESGYDRTISPGQATAANLFYFGDPFKLFFQTIPAAILTGLDNGFESIGLGRVFGTTRPDTAGQGAYGIGGPAVTPTESSTLAADTGSSARVVAAALAGGITGEAGATAGTTGSTEATTTPTETPTETATTPTETTTPPTESTTPPTESTTPPTGGSGSTGGSTSDESGSGSGAGDESGSGSGTSGSDTSGSGTSGTDTSGSGTSGSGTGTSGSGTSGTDTSGSGTSGSGTSGTDTSGSGTSGSGTSGSGTSGSGTSGSGTSGSGTSGSGTSGSGSSSSS